MTDKKNMFEEKSKISSKSEKWFGVRHEQYLLLVVAIVIAYGMRTAFNVAVIAMVAKDPPNDDVPTYPEWAGQKNMMLSSFFWGYVCLQLVAAQLAKAYGPKLFLGASIFVSSIFCVFLPVMGERLGYGGVIASRAIQGLAQGFIFPCVHNMLGVWAPIRDRAKVGSFVYAGCSLGTVMALPVAGEISASSFGWPLMFYVYGGLGIVWTAAWTVFGSNSPSAHKRISDEERRYVEDGTATGKKESIPTPWMSIFTSVPFIAIIVTDIGNAWGFFTLFSEIPSYMQSILKFDIDSNSLLSALPYLSSLLLGYVMSPIADALVSRKIVTLGVSRKIFSSIALFLPAVALFALNFVGSTQKELTIFLLVLAVGLNVGVYSGHCINHIDLSPVHAGTLMGITNTISVLFSIVTPLSVDVVKSMTGYEETDKSLWNIIFSFASVVYVLAGLFYIFAASAEVQPWNYAVVDKTDYSDYPMFENKKKEGEAKIVTNC